jgi:hypothetical protein
VWRHSALWSTEWSTRVHVLTLEVEQALLTAVGETKVAA